MPSFSFLKSSREVSEEVGEQKDNRKRRDYFRWLLKRSSLSSQARANRRASGPFASMQSSPTPSPRPPMSPINTQKPLPPPPPGSEPEPKPEPRAKSPPAPIKLARIISPLSSADLHKIFSGAPQFFARSEGHHTGAPHPSVAFPWDSEVNIRDLTDHRQIADDAWGCVTAWPHITSHTSRSAKALKEHGEKQRAHFLPRCRERPNMLSMQGIERATTGYGAALEIGVADALEIPDETLNGDPESIAEHRKKFLNGKDGLRPVTDSTLIERLMDVSEVYHDDPLKHRRPVVQLYTELFTQILFPPSRVTDPEDPYSLQVQVEELIHVLAAPIVWVDFSNVEWRIKLGQILWGGSPDAEQDDEIAINNEIIHESTDQKYWLLLQILLASELLIRLDAISMNIDHGVDPVKPAEIQRFEKDATTSVKWSLILARAWLENIQVQKLAPKNLGDKKPAGWLATLTGAASSDIPVEGIASLQFHGRHQTRQLDGLVHFARKIGWPYIESLVAKICINGITITDSIQNTPTGTPLSISTQRSTSYFSNRRPGIRRGLSLNKNVSAITHPKGWLSNSYLSGLILPGEGLSHFLMSTLLENDSAAVARLGEQANLYGGFIFSGKSFWSTACIVGRILAAGKGSFECMGWISSNVLPRGVGESWVDIDVEYAVLDDPNTKSGKPRLWQKTTIEHDGNVLGGADSSTVLPGDFILPSDASIQPPISVIFKTLDLFSAEDDSLESTPEDDTPTPTTELTELPSIQTYSAMMRFSVRVDGEDEKELNVALTHDVHFVTAHPCIPSPHNDLLRSSASPTSPTFQNSQLSLVAPQSNVKGHPLHKAFTYTTISLATLISTPVTTPFSSLLVLSVSTSLPKSADTNSAQSSTHTTNSKIPKVLIVECTTTDVTTADEEEKSTENAKSAKGHHFGSDLEMLARALCAERGWNALISRRGRDCVACAVREAGALGWRVILRVS